MNDNEILQINGLSPLQLVELKSQLDRKDQGKALVDDLEGSDLREGQHGEPSLMSVLIELTPVVISIVAMWLAKQKGERTDVFSYKKKLPDGTFEEIKFRRSEYEEGAASAAQIEAFLKDKLHGTAEGTPA